MDYVTLLSTAVVAFVGLATYIYYQRQFEAPHSHQYNNGHRRAYQAGDICQVCSNRMTEHIAELRYLLCRHAVHRKCYDRMHIFNYECQDCIPPECPICYEHVIPDNGEVRLPCGHKLHESCLSRLRRSSSETRCPLCRANIN